ncbi:hypothetical protein [Alicyclobacillus sp. ALC3]|uniref:hypothetical protein n=1 Tax=Alicyclobacillus sp. ALC3 TaxID=2796143 RepID=UPI002378CF2D|nr:hypothetical protein [Alicyclobacillus sp. ALC3]WDL99090.1 hypothetical protein JC200_10815 [Alicyclobacillus sp. ALC3]
MDDLKAARIYAYTRTSYLVIYSIVLIGFLVWALTLMSRLPSIHGTVSNWFQFDTPWVCIVVLIWIPALQNISYRRNVINILVDKANSTCMIEEGTFAGRWRLHKKSPRSMSTTKVLTIVGLALIAVIIATNLAELQQAIEPTTKVYAVQGLCEAGCLMGIGTPLSSFWKYPYLVAVRQGDKWLSLQYRD